MRKLLLLIILSCNLLTATAQNHQSSDLQNLLKSKPHLKEKLNTEHLNSAPLNREQLMQTSALNSQSIGGISLLGGNGRNTGEFIVTDENDNTYIIGVFRVSMELGGQIIEGNATDARYIAKYDSSNELVFFKNLIDSEVNSNIRVHAFSFFDNGLILLGQSNDDIILNGNSVAINDNNIFLLKLNTDGSTAWYKDYEDNLYGNSRVNKTPLAHNNTHIFTCFENTTITKLDTSGEIVDSHSLSTQYGFITSILAQPNSLVLGGYFDDPIAIGDTTLYSENMFETSFITSLDINNYDREWAHHNGTLVQNEPGDSWAQNLLADEAGNIYLKGTFRNKIQWGGDQYQGIMIPDQFISKFRSNGAIDTTIVLTGSIDSETILNDKIYLTNASMYGIDGNTSTSEDNIIVLDTAYNFIESIKFPISSNSYQITEVIARNGDLALTGDIDYNSVFFTLDTSDLSVVSENRSQSKNNGYFNILGLESINSTEYIAGNKNGSIQLYDSILSDSSTAIIAGVKNKTIENITSFYNATFSYFYPHTLKANSSSHKLIVKGTAKSNFHINENQYDIEGNFLAQINTDGSVDWVKDLSALDELHSLSYDDVGNIYLSGVMREDFNANDMTYNLNGLFADFFVMKITASGEMEWFKNFGSSTAGTYSSAISFAEDQLIFSGEYSVFEETIIEGSGISVSLGTTELGKNILIAFNNEGNVNWAKAHGQSANVNNSFWATALTSSTEGDFYMIGFFGENNSIDDITLESSYSLNHFVAKYDASGNAIWANPIRTSQFGFNYAEIGTDENDNVYVQGGFPKEIQFGTDTLTSQGWQTVYVAKYSSSGEFENVSTFYGDYLFARVMDIKGEDNLSIGGNINRSYDIGSGAENSYLGNSYIVDLCTMPSKPSAPNGLTEVFHEDSTSYISNNKKYNQVDWVLTPATAGQLLYIEKDSIAIKWNSDFTGEAKLKLKQLNDCGESEFSDELTINVNEAEVTANDSELKDHIVFYPNPVNSQLNLDWSKNLTVTSIQLLDLTGREVINTLLPQQTKNATINLEKLIPGTYILIVNTSTGDIVNRIIKQ